MHSLEDALAITQRAVSNQPHPLLTQPFDLDDESEGEPKLKPQPQGPIGPQPLGKFLISKDGASRFFGPSGDAEVCLLRAAATRKTLTQPTESLMGLSST